MFFLAYMPSYFLSSLRFPTPLPFLGAVLQSSLLVGTHACPDSFPLLWRLLSADSYYLFPASLVCWHLVVGSPREDKRYCWKSLWVSAKCCLGNEWLGFVFHLTACLGKGLQQLPGRWRCHSNIDNIAVNLLLVLYFRLMKLIPVCAIYPKELLQDYGVYKTDPSVRHRGEHPALFSTVIIRRVSVYQIFHNFIFISFAVT